MFSQEPLTQKTLVDKALSWVLSNTPTQFELDQMSVVEKSKRQMDRKNDRQTGISGFIVVV